MYVQKNVKLTTSTDLGLIRTCAGAHADGIRYSSEEEAETARGFVARGRGPRSKAMHYHSRERVTWSVLTAVMAALTGMSPRSQPKQIPGARKAAHRDLLLEF